MIMFPHISLFHNVLKYVEHVNTDPEVPVESRITRPITFRGSIKLHGSTCGVIWTPGDSLRAPSREGDLTPEADYKGFAKFVKEHDEYLRTLIHDQILPRIPGTVVQLALYGEWVGAGVVSRTKGVAVAKFDPKHWALFSVWAVTSDNERVRVNVSNQVLDNLQKIHPRIGNVRKAGNWTITVDFNDPASVEAAQVEAARVTASIEAQCPYGDLYGLDGAGEGIVWIPQGEFLGREDLYWKHKTEAHSVVLESKVTRERPIVAEDVQVAIKDFVLDVVSENRLFQGLDALEQQGLKAEKRNTGKFIQWISADVARECSLKLEDYGLVWDQVSTAVGNHARTFFLANAK